MRFQHYLYIVVGTERKILIQANHFRNVISLIETCHQTDIAIFISTKSIDYMSYDEDSNTIHKVGRATIPRAQMILNIGDEQVIRHFGLGSEADVIRCSERLIKGKRRKSGKIDLIHSFWRRQFTAKSGDI